MSKYEPESAQKIINASSMCNICGCVEFKPGPNGRISNGRMPMCGGCGSLERHRAIFKCYELLLKKSPAILKESIALQFAKDVSIKPEWFRSWDYSEYGGHNTLNIMELSLQDNSVDWFILNHILEHVSNDKIAIAELARVLTKTGVMQITVPTPLFCFETIDWGYPDPRKILHYREYGADFIPYAGAICREMDLHGLVALPMDPVSAVSEAVIFISKDTMRCKDIFNAIKSGHIPSIRIN